MDLKKSISDFIDKVKSVIKSPSGKKIAMILFFAAALVAFCIVGVVDMMGPKEKKESTVAAIEVQDPSLERLEDSKSKAYSESMQTSKTENYWDELEGVDSVSQSPEDDLLSEKAAEDAANPNHIDMPKTFSSEDIIKAVTGSATPAENKEEVKSNANTNTNANANVNAEPKPGTPEYHEYRMKQYYDKLDASAAAAPQESAAQQPTADATAADNGEEEQAKAADEASPVPIGEVSRVKKTSILSSLSDDDYDQTGVFSSLADDDEGIDENEDYPFMCMFVRNEKLRDGSRVSIRLLEDMVVSGLLIPKNTHIMATCKINTRLELNVTSIEKNSKIYSIGYTAYDTDGGRGIYCPDLNSEEKQQVKQRGSSLISSLIGSRFGRLASDIVQTGVSIAQSKSGEVVVSVPAGYRFFIVKSKRN